MTFEYEIQGLKEFEAAIRRNPQYVIQRTNVFLVRGLAEYRRVIFRQPWSKGASGGGAPVSTGNLRDTHQQEISNLEARIYPTAPYAKYVHGIPGIARTRSYQLRPWLDYAFDTARPAIDDHQRELVDDIVKNLAS
jgi:hypothetical protein